MNTYLDIIIDDHRKRVWKSDLFDGFSFNGTNTHVECECDFEIGENNKNGNFSEMFRPKAACRIACNTNVDKNDTVYLTIENTKHITQR